jgi:hypothetical protein
MKPLTAFCTNTSARSSSYPQGVAALTEDWCDDLGLLSDETKYGLLLALAGKIYAIQAGCVEPSYTLSQVAEDVLGDPSHESHADLPGILEILDDIPSAEALRFIAFLSQSF